jgi:hypothetical protein
MAHHIDEQITNVLSYSLFSIGLPKGFQKINEARLYRKVNPRSQDKDAANKGFCAARAAGGPAGRRMKSRGNAQK